MTAPSFVNAGHTGTQGFGTSFTGDPPTLPGSRVNGNLLLALVTGCATAVAHTYSFGSGWIPIDHIAATDASGALAYRIVDGTETVPAVTWNGNESTACVILQYTGVDPTNPIGSIHKNGPTTAQTTSTDGGINMQRNNSLALAITLGDTGSQTPTSGPGGFWNGSADYVNTAGNASIVVYGSTWWATATFTTGIWSVTFSSARNWDGFTIELASEALITEVDIPTSGTIANGMGFTEAATITKEQTVAASPSLGFSQATTIDISGDLSATESLGLTVFASFDAAIFITSVAANLGFSMAAALDTQLFASAAPALGINMAATLSRSIELSAAPALGFAMRDPFRSSRRRQPVICVVS